MPGGSSASLGTRRIVSRRRLIGLGLVAALAVTIAGLFSGNSRMQVIGTIAPDDLTQILRLVRQNLRNHLLPRVEWDSLRYPRYVISSLKDYHAQHILWAEAHDDGHVEVYAGASKTVIRDEGHHWQFRKEPNWSLTGYSYWAFSNGAPADIHVPP